MSVTPMNPSLFESDVDELKSHLFRYQVEYNIRAEDDLDAMFDAFSRIEGDLETCLCLFADIETVETETGYHVTVDVLSDGGMKRFSDSADVTELDY